jgi:pimeloyl-ACP methyl ester carboxylesterase
MPDREPGARPLFVYRFGARGPLVVAVHGLGASGRSWRLVAERLSGQARLLCPDLLGFGRSPWPAVASTVAGHIAALTATLDALGVTEPVLLTGHSTGAVLALEWAAARPDRFRAVLPASLPAYRTPAEARACISSLSPLAWATVARPRWGELICGVMCAWRPFWQRVVPLLIPNVPADIARDYVLHNWTAYSTTLQNVLIDHRVEPAATTLAATGLPVHLLHGGRDTVAPLAAVHELAGRHGWSVSVLPEQGHHLPIRRPRAYARLLRALVTDAGAATRSQRG